MEICPLSRFLHASPFANAYTSPVSELHSGLSKLLRKRIREFEDRKISAADLAREVHFAAREIKDGREAGLRRALERHGNRINALNERGLGSHITREVLEVIDELMNELVDFGY